MARQQTIAVIGGGLGGLTAGIVLLLNYVENRKAEKATEIDSDVVIAETIEDREL